MRVLPLARVTFPVDNPNFMNAPEYYRHNFSLKNQSNSNNRSINKALKKSDL